MSIMNQEYFARNLVSVHDYFHGPNFDVEHYSKKVMQAFMFFGSDTPSNKSCFEALNYGNQVIPDRYYVLYGFKLRDKPIFVQDILSILQTISMPQAVQDYYTDLTQAEWNAAILMTIKVVQAFSPRKMKDIEPGWNVASQYFARKLWSIYDYFDYSDFDVAKFNHRIMQAFMMFHWTDPGNEQCYQLLEFGQTPALAFDGIHYGFKIKSKSIRLSDILNELESLTIPEEVGETFPDLLPNEWSAIMRMATMIVLAFSPVV